MVLTSWFWVTQTLPGQGGYSTPLQPPHHAAGWWAAPVSWKDFWDHCSALPVGHFTSVPSLASDWQVMSCSLNLCKMDSQSLCEWDCSFSLPVGPLLILLDVAICGRQECGVVSKERWHSSKHNDYDLKNWRELYTWNEYNIASQLYLSKNKSKEKKKILEILKSVTAPPPCKSSGEDMVGRCVVLCSHYKIPKGKFHMARKWIILLLFLLTLGAMVWICVPSKITRWNPNAQCGGEREWGPWEGIRSWSPYEWD